MLFYIETERLIMRDLLLSDDDGMFELDSDPEVHRFIGNKPVQTIEESRKVIDIIRQQYEDNGIGRLAVIEKSAVYWLVFPETDNRTYQWPQRLLRPWLPFHQAILGQGLCQRNCTGISKQYTGNPENQKPLWYG
jgi:RimJ/RimL family protein N-acetyltransferase